MTAPYFFILEDIYVNSFYSDISLLCFSHLLPSTPVIVAEVDEVQLGVCKVDPLGGDVQGQAVGPVDLGADDGLPQRPVHSDPLDPRVLAPVSPEQPAGVGRGVQAQAPRLRDVLLGQQVWTLTQFTM